MREINYFLHCVKIKNTFFPRHDGFPPFKGVVGMIFDYSHNNSIVHRRDDNLCICLNNICKSRRYFIFSARFEIQPNHGINLAGCHCFGYRAAVFPETSI